MSSICWTDQLECSIEVFDNKVNLTWFNLNRVYVYLLFCECSHFESSSAQENFYFLAMTEAIFLSLFRTIHGQGYESD